VELYEERSGEGVTYFELTTALAFAWCADRAVDVAVVETGLGGRLDASNAADAAVAVVTGVGLEHTDYMGETIGEIAAEKLAILPDSGILVTGDLADDAERVARLRVEETGSRWLRYGVDLRVADAAPAVGGWFVTVEGAYGVYPDLHLTLHGRHQVHNLAVAVGAVEALFDRALDPSAVVEAAAAVTAPGRMEVVRRYPIVMVDGAHNPPGMGALSAALDEEFPTVEWRLVFGAMSDKNVGGMLDLLATRAVAVHAVAADTPRALPAREVAELASAAVGASTPVEAHGSVAEAVAIAAASGDPVLVTGSIYVVGEARIALGVHSGA
jgi:dihydrofolate synthase/folylpolyglutamate synthase